MPHRSTPDQDDPNTLDKIKSILAMDLNDPLRKIPSSNTKSRTKHRENQLLSVHDGSSKSRSRRRKDKRSQKSRPTTAL